MRTLIALLATLTLTLTACGGDDDDASPTPTGATSTATPSAPPSTDGTAAPSATPCQTFPLDIYRVDIGSGFSTTVAHGVDGRWSPNGSYFAYYVSPGSQACDQGLVIDAATSHQRQYVFTLPVWDWAWSPDSTSVAIASYTFGQTNATDGLYIVPVSGGDPERAVEGPVTEISWGLNGLAVAYATDANTQVGIFAVDLHATAAFDLTDSEGGILELSWAPSAGSPTGDRLAAVTYENDANGNTIAHHLYTLSIPDGTASDLTGPRDVITNIQWSPDSATLLYEVANDSIPGQPGGVPEGPWIYGAPADGSAPRLHVQGAQAKFSPDGSLITYVAGWCSTFDIAVIAPDGSGNTIVSPGTVAGPQLEPTWSPDGTLIAFHSDATYTVTPDGATLTRVRDAMESLDWAPSGQFLTGQAIGGRGLCEG